MKNIILATLFDTPGFSQTRSVDMPLYLLDRKAVSEHDVKNVGISTQFDFQRITILLLWERPAYRVY